MLRLRTWFKTIFILGVLAFTFFGTAEAQKSSVPRPQDRLALGEANVKQLLLLMEADSDGKVSRQTYMKFMEAEFERLDKSSAGHLDARQLNSSTLTAARFTGK